MEKIRFQRRFFHWRGHTQWLRIFHFLRDWRGWDRQFVPVIIWQSDNWNYHGIMERVDPTLEYHKCELYKINMLLMSSRSLK